MKTYCPRCRSETYTYDDGVVQCTRCYWWHNYKMADQLDKLEYLYQMTVKQRDSAWREIEKLKKERDEYKSMLELRGAGITKDIGVGTTHKKRIQR